MSTGLCTWSRIGPGATKVWGLPDSRCHNMGRIPFFPSPPPWHIAAHPSPHPTPRLLLSRTRSLEGPPPGLPGTRPVLHSSLRPVASGCSLETRQEEDRIDLSQWRPRSQITVQQLSPTNRWTRSADRPSIGHRAQPLPSQSPHRPGLGLSGITSRVHRASTAGCSSASCCVDSARQAPPTGVDPHGS